MRDYSLGLPNGWTASFAYGGEFAMGCDKYGLVLSKGDVTIDYFKDRGVICGNIETSNDGRYGKVVTIEGSYVVDFIDLTMSCYCYVISLEFGGKRIAVTDQPVMDLFARHVEIGKNTVYLTFPFRKCTEFNRYFYQYLESRREHLKRLSLGWG